MILIGLNEINFNVVKELVALGKLPNLSRLLQKTQLIETESETKYEHLEPWIQWVTLQTGKTFAEHQIFRLGDIVEHDDAQIWETLEALGLSCGAVSPMNAANKMKKPAYFIPDPWTKTQTSASKLLQKTAETVSQLVNSNTSFKLRAGQLFPLGLAFLAHSNLSQKKRLIGLALGSRSKPWKRAVFLDYFLSCIHISLYRKKTPDFSSLFLNAGAHFQHHYFFNSCVYQGEQKNPEWVIPREEDPLLEVLETYDSIVGEHLALGTSVVLATGLSQVFCEKPIFYWRPKDHTAFMERFSIPEFKAIPRMSRDLVLEFANAELASIAEKRLLSFEEIESRKRVFSVDNRGQSLFIEIVFDGPIDQNTRFQSADDHNGGSIVDHLDQELSFVAIKNGIHNSTGYLIDIDSKLNIQTDSIALADIFSKIVEHYQ